MKEVHIAGKKLALSKNEIREAQRIVAWLGQDRTAAQRAADIWMRSAYGAQVDRRKAAVRAMGLSDTVAFL